MVKKPFTSRPAIKLPTSAKGATASRRGRLTRWRGGSCGALSRVSATGSIAAITKIAASVKISLLEGFRLKSAMPAVKAT